MSMTQAIRRAAALAGLCLSLCCCSCLTFKSQVALGPNATQAATGFKPRAERRMIYTYVGRIYEMVGDYPRAIDYFQRKLDEYPAAPKESQRTQINTEKSVILNQMGTYAFRLGRYEDALGYYRRSLKLADEIGSVHGVVANSANMGRVVLSMFDYAPAKVMQSLLSEVIIAQSHALELIADAADYPHPEYRVYLRSNAAALSQRAAAIGLAPAALKSKPNVERKKG